METPAIETVKLQKRMKYLLVATIIMLTACAMSSGPHDVFHTGKKEYFIDAMTEAAAFKEAARLCPNGYHGSNPKQSSPLDFLMNVECDSKPAPAAPTAQ
jgi:hypothetical protein